MKDRVIGGISLAAGAVGLIFAFAGTWIEYHPGAGRPSDYPLGLLAGILDNLWRSFALFAFESDIQPHHNWFLVLARLLLPAAAAGTIYVLAADYFSKGWNVLHLWRMRAHTVIIGLGDRGCCFLNQSDAPVAALDIAASASPGKGNGVEVRSLTGDGRDLGMLRQVGVPHARRVLILGGDDSVNLEILGHVLECRGDNSGPLEVVVGLRNRALARQLDREDEFVRRQPAGSGSNARAPQIEVVPFEPDRVAAQQLLRDYPLVDMADLRAQPRVHVVLIGWSGFALEFMEQLARLAPYRDFEPPRVDLMAHRREAVHAELVAAQPAFLNGLVLAGAAPTPASPGPSGKRPKPVLEIHLHELAAELGVPTPEQIRSIEPGDHGTVTAVVVTLGSDDSSVAAAMALRERSNIEGRWQSPIFAHVAATSTLTSLLESRSSLRDPADQIIPVGTTANTCRIENLFGEREKAAREFHEAYLVTAKVEDVPIERRYPNQMPWELLAQTYRNANRRAVDHLPIKLLSVGYLISGRPLRTAQGQPVGADTDERNLLAALEHRSWEIDRLLEGWRGGEARDNRRRINEAIGVLYDDLDKKLGKPMQRYDQEQVDVASRTLASAKGALTVKREVRLGVLGPGYVSEADLDRIHEALEREMPPFIQAHSEDAVSIFTLLAPGADLMITEEISGMLRKENVEQRLVVLQTMPREALIADCLPHIEAGGRWTTSITSPTKADEEAASQIRKYLDKFVEDHRAVIANLLPVASTMEDWRDPARRQQAGQRAEAYLELRCDVLMVFDGPKSAGQDAGSAEGPESNQNTVGIPAEYSLGRRDAASKTKRIRLNS
jgi:hypothetical protein